MAAFEDIWYRSGDGLQLYARDYRCRNSAGEAAGTVLCMHGLSRNSADFAALAEHLCGEYRVLCVDQRGRGRSAYDKVVSNYAAPTYVQDMFTLLDSLAIDEVILIGTSMGGLMSFVMAAMQPERVRAMVINDIGPELDPRGLARIKSYVGKLQPVDNWEQALAQARIMAGDAFPDFSEQEWLDFTRGIFREENGVPVLAYDPAIAQPLAAEDASVAPDLWPVFAGLGAVPMLLLRGEKSDILSPECVARMRACKADLHYREVPRRGHAPTLNEPAARAAIDAFLRLPEITGEVAV